MSVEHCDVIVMGAGIAGLVAARRLCAAGLSVVVLEKSRGVGGRMATRRIGAAVFDHGAQFFTVRDARFSELVDRMVADGAVRVWFNGTGDDAHPRFRGAPSMTAPAKWLARDLDVRCGCQVESVGFDAGSVQVDLSGGVRMRARWSVITAPAPQALAVCGGVDGRLPASLKDRLARVEYAPCFALLLLMDGGAAREQGSGFERLDDDVVACVSANHLKGVSPVGRALTLHATPEFSRAHFDADASDVQQMLLAAAGDRVDGAIVECALHRWRYSLPLFTGTESCVAAEGCPLVFAGDGFGGGRVEGAAISGMAAADHVLWALSLR